ANSVYGSGAFYHQPNYEGAGPVNILYEMGYSDNISIGVNFSYYSIIAKRQRIAKELLAYGQIITAPKEMSIYQEFSPEAVVTYHFFTNQALDPYVRGSLGLIFAGGDSIHRDIYENYLRTSDDLTNGRGFSYGFGGGANYHFNSYLYTFFEGNFKFRHIMADQFSTYRTLRSFTFNIGVGINFSDVYY
ncbi:MAG: hypothetical protein KDK45_19250, partial [Leptospiraceae bacterium]|nr:hypothetical protein [Leptospiraceae bacterium]